MPLPRDQAWFYAKSYGWGWGLPARWQGWIVLAGFFAGMITVGVCFVPTKHPVAFALGVLGLGTALLVICWRKGEAPKWRWGDGD